MEDDDGALESTVQPRFVQSLNWLRQHLLPAFLEADRLALRRQRDHRWLAQSCITAGAVAIVLAILQLALQQIFKPLTTAAMVAEAVVIAFAAAAVAFGLVARRNHDWLVQRHRAERLRSLKFESLGRPELIRGDQTAWEKWVRERIEEIRQIGSLEDVVNWASGLGVEPGPATTGNLPTNSTLSAQVAAYYVVKRVEFQAAYFSRRQGECHHQAGHWPHRGAWFFFGSVACVLLHVGLDLWMIRHSTAGEHHPVLHNLAVSLLALAAILPVVGFGIRAWFTAFELPRSASLFGSKAKALQDVARTIRASAEDPAATLRHIAQTEHFLQHEHGEWIRLIRDTEWFL